MTEPDETGSTSVAEAGDPQVTKRQRERSAVAFPYEDLATAIRLAKLLHNAYGVACTLEQLAGAANASVNSGAFRGRVGAARMFGVLGGTGSNVQLGSHGEGVLDDENIGARADAFLTVPLYRLLYDDFKNALPSDAGLEARIREHGVPQKQVVTARQVFLRSADQAGFFRHGRGRLVMPPRGTVQVQAVQSGGTENHASTENTDRTGVNGSSGVMTHPLIVGLLAALPEPGSAFEQEDKDVWLQTFAMNLSIIYKTPKHQKVDPSGFIAERDGFAEPASQSDA